MSLLIPDIGLLFWMTLSFSVVLFVLVRYGFPVILGAVDRRREYISSSLEKAQAAEDQLATLNTQAQSITDTAQKERGEILRRGEQSAAAIIEQAKQQAAELSRLSLTRARQEAEQLKRSAMDEVMDSLAGLSIKIAEKVVGEELRDPGRQKKLIEDAIRNEIKE